MAQQVSSRSEDQVSQKYDKCIADAIVKFGGGLAVGMVVSVALFRRRMWPAIFGAGLGTGIAYGNCQNSLNEPFLVPATRVRVADAGALRSLRLRTPKTAPASSVFNGSREEQQARHHQLQQQWQNLQQQGMSEWPPTTPEQTQSPGTDDASGQQEQQWQHQRHGASQHAIYEAAQAFYQTQPIHYDGSGQAEQQQQQQQQQQPPPTPPPPSSWGY